MGVSGPVLVFLRLLGLWSLGFTLCINPRPSCRYLLELPEKSYFSCIIGALKVTVGEFRFRVNLRE